MKYPEYLFGDISSEENALYKVVRDLLFQMGLDKANFGTSKWNPFGTFISPGNKVVIKPNWVRDFNPISQGIDGLVTHPSILRVVIDYCLIALKNKGEIIFGDAPIQLTNFENLTSKMGIPVLLDFYQGKTDVKISLRDFRREIKYYDKGGAISRHIWLEDKNFVEIDLAEKSFLYPLREQYKKFRVTNYDPRKMLYFHNADHNRYVIEKEVMEADVVIQLPKLKTHRKAGITGCMKNSVGINSQKDALVHHRKGSFFQGGDAYPKFNIFKALNENLYEWREEVHIKFIQRLFARIIGINNGIIKRSGINNFFEGSWHGNNTLWRTILDLTNILFYCDKWSVYHQKQVRNVFYLVDAVVGGDKEGPLKPRDVNASFLAAGWNPVLMDIANAKLVGFDHRKIPSLAKALETNLLGSKEEDLFKQNFIFNGNMMRLSDLPVVVKYEPSNGWKNHIELNQ